MYPHLKEVYMTRATAALAEVLIWKATLVIADRERRPRPFASEDIERFKAKIRPVEPGEVLDFPGFRAIPVANGHILGSVSWIFVPKGAAPVFISGDMSFQDQEIVPGAASVPEEFREFGVALIESTNLDRVGYRRENVTRVFEDFVTKVLARRGQVLIPAFSIGRAPEIYTIIRRSRPIQQMLRRVGGRVYVDGSARDGFRVYKKLAPRRFDYDERDLVRGMEETLRLLGSDQPMIVIASSGMVMEGSRSALYAQKFLGRERNAIALVGYQAPGTPGAALEASRQNSFVRFGDGVYWRVCDVKRFFFSAHMDKLESIALQRRLRAKITVLNHGDPAVIQKFINEERVANPARDIRRARAGEEVVV
jgi:Cft2 family RNA processing exonuclease